MRTALTVLVLSVGTVSAQARAEVCPAPADAPAVERVDAVERLDYLARAFDREVEDIDLWSWTWGSIYTAGTIAEGVGLSLTHDAGTRTDLTVGVVATAVGAVSLYALPLKLTLPLRASRRHWRDSDRCATLAQAERTLVQVERDQAVANGPLAHVGNVVVNVGLVLILGLGYGRWTSAAVSGGVGVAVGEANALTQPHHLRDVLARYRAGELDAPEPALVWSVSPVVERTGGSAVLTFAW
jgi:hypothetical protein